MEVRRPLKRNLPRLGPPDIYPQDPRQKEDELTSVNVKHGYSSVPLVSGPNTLDEFGTAKHANIDAFGVYFSALLSEKHRINTIRDTQKKKQFVNTKEIWYVHAKTKNAVDNWFRDLANGTKSLGQLGKRIPIFNSKEGIFTQLYESRVPLTKAVWFIKMSAVHAIAVSESSSKSKKRQAPDQYQELTTALSKYLKEILARIFDCYQQAQQSQVQQPSLNNHGQDSSRSQALLMKLNTPKVIPQQIQTAPSPSDTSYSHDRNNNLTTAQSSISSLLNDQSNFTGNLHTSVANLVTSHTASVASLIASLASSLQAGSDEFQFNYNQWQYQTQLARYLFDEGLLDRHDFLCFLLELIEKKRPTSDLVVKLICPFVLEYVIEFSKSAVLSRRLAHVCAKKLSQAMHHNNSSSSSLYSNVIYILSSVIQVICIECPTAMVRHHIVDSKYPSIYQGSPLDSLPCLPSSLPMMDSELNSELKRSVHQAENEIIYRSAMSDSKWSCTSSRRAESSKSVLVNRLLTVLDTLDKFNFDKIDSTNSYDVLYSKIFPTSNQSTIKQASSNSEAGSKPTVDSCDDTHPVQVDLYEEHVIRILCEWATTPQRTGEHRALVAARLLERRQTDLQAKNQENKATSSVRERNPSSNPTELCESEPSAMDVDVTLDLSKPKSNVAPEEPHDEVIEYVFQDLLVRFLDENAPVIDDEHNLSQDVVRAFNNLVLLFSELIRCDVFSHYNYMCTLISRGMFNDLAVTDKTQSALSDSHIDDVDADLGKILQDIKEGQQDEAADILLPDYLGGGATRDDIGNKNTHMNKLSPFGLSDRSTGLDNTSSSSANVMSANNFQPNSVDTKPLGMSMGGDKSPAHAPKEQRHMIFVKHFPIPDDENFARDMNQRNILFHGFGKEREDARHSVKKLNKEICKLLNRRASRDINDGGRVKKIATREYFNPETTLHKFELLNNHDQHIITNSLAMNILEMFTGVSNGQTSSLPTLESISFIFDLFSMASNVSGLLELIVPLLEELPDVEAQIKLKCPSLSNQYTHSVAMCIVGMLYRYHSCVLLMSKEEASSIFESLYKLVAHVQNPSMCMTSAERVIFIYLYDLYLSHMNGKSFNQYSWLMQKIKQQLQNINTSPPNVGLEHEWTSTFLTNIVSQLRTLPSCSSSSANPILIASSGIPSLSNYSPVNICDLVILVQQQLYAPDSIALRQMNESPGARYRFVCDAIYLSATCTDTDVVNDIAVICADLTSKCPALMNDWISALQALLCSAQRELSYRQILDKINTTDPRVMDNIAIFTAILVARRCIQLDEFIIKCAIGAILAPLGPVDRNSTESGVRLTCHLLLTIFRNRESSSGQSRCNQPPLYNSQSAFGQAFSNFGSNMPNYNNILGSVSQMNILQPMSKDLEGSSKILLNLKYLCDHHLLRSACCNIRTECHITLLKAIRVLAISSNLNPEVETQTRVKSENLFEDIGVDGLGQMGKDGLDRLSSSPNSMERESGLGQRHFNLQTATLHQYADAILRLLCSQRWLHDKCLADSDIFTTTDPEKNILLDPRIDVKQSQRLLYMICYNKSPELQADVGLDDQGSDQMASIVKMFENLDVWSMRLSLMRLQFMFAYCKSQSNVMLNDWLDNLAKAVVEFFQKSSQDSESGDKENDESTDSSGKVKGNKDSMTNESVVTNISKVWLVEPLLNKLTKPPSAVSGKIIKASASLMESASVRANSLPSLNQTYLSTAAASTKFKERTLSQRGSASTNPSNLASTSLLGFEPFLSLLLSCLKSQDKERETLLTSLNSQLYQAIHEKVDDIAYKQSLQDGLELRLCLIGQMFDTIQRSPNLTSDWATLLLLLIMNNLVDPQIDYGLYVSVLDMLAMLIQTAYASDPIEHKEEAKKQYQNLMKKFRKELAALEEKGFIQMRLINPLMPLVRHMTEVITCEPMGSLVDTKGEKVENFYSIDKKKGLKVSELQEVSPWDLIEGHKNPAPLCWPWFGAIKLEHKPLRSDENNRLLSWHTHTVRLDTTYYGQTPDADDGPSGIKRQNIEKKPSRSNPLLKSLIEADDEINPMLRRDALQTNLRSNEYEHNHSIESDLKHSWRDDLLEDYFELPVDSLFDSTPVETMIEDIKIAMQAEDNKTASRPKPAIMPLIRPVVEPKPPPSPMMTPQASSILAPARPMISEPIKAPSPHVSALSALQNHLNAPSITVPEQKPKATRKKRTTKKDAVIPPQHQHPQVQAQLHAPMQQQQQTRPHMQSTPLAQPNRPADSHTPVAFQTLSQPQHSMSTMPPAPRMQVPTQVPQQQQQQQQQHHMQLHPQSQQHSQVPPHAMQQHNHPQLHYQSQPQMQHPTHNQHPQHIQQNPQMRMQEHHQPNQIPFQSVQMHQHNQMGSHGPSNQIQMGHQGPQQHMQQQPQQQQQQQHIAQHHQHHQLQYQPQGPQQQQQQQLLARQHQVGPHMAQQQVRLAGHQQPMQFQPGPQPPPHQHQQQMFAPQQAAGHSRPALTAMLHQKYNQAQK